MYEDSSTPSSLYRSVIEWSSMLLRGLAEIMLFEVRFRLLFLFLTVLLSEAFCPQLGTYALEILSSLICSSLICSSGWIKKPLSQPLSPSANAEYHTLFNSKPPFRDVHNRLLSRWRLQFDWPSFRIPSDTVIHSATALQ